VHGGEADQGRAAVDVVEVVVCVGDVQGAEVFVFV
jgi:hypothetical protein